MLSGSEASLVPEAEILHFGCGLVQDDNRFLAQSAVCETLNIEFSTLNSL
jgi:hypothetical protein